MCVCVCVCVCVCDLRLNQFSFCVDMEWITGESTNEVDIGQPFSSRSVPTGEMCVP